MTDIQLITKANLLSTVGPLIFPIGTIWKSTNSDNPNTYFGFGTWIPIEGVFLVGYKSSDPYFGVEGNTGGSIDHSHKIDPPVTNSSGPSETIITELGTGASPASLAHYHEVNIAEFDSAIANNLPPYRVAYFWERIE